MRHECEHRHNAGEYHSQQRAPKNDLAAVFPWGDGQNLLREAVLVIDHNSYHLGELLALRRLLGIWK